MDNQQRHEMILEHNHPSGAQEWCCPTCGQCLLMTRTPRFMTVIRKARNGAALHTLGSYQQSRSEQINLTEEARLAPWIAWLEAIDFENLWNDKVE